MRVGDRDSVEGVTDRDRLRQLEADLAQRDPSLLAAAGEVDVTLIDWALGLSPFERLRACSKAAKALTGWRRVTSEDR